MVFSNSQSPREYEFATDTRNLVGYVVDGAALMIPPGTPIAVAGTDVGKATLAAHSRP